MSAAAAVQPPLFGTPETHAVRPLRRPVLAPPPDSRRAMGAPSRARARATDTAVLAELARHAGRDGTVCVAVEAIAAGTGFCPKTCSRSLARLITAGQLRRLRRGNGTGVFGTYQLTGRGSS